MERVDTMDGTGAAQVASGWIQCVAFVELMGSMHGFRGSREFNDVHVIDALDVSHVYRALREWNGWVLWMKCIEWMDVRLSEFTIVHIGQPFIHVPCFS